MELLAVPDRSTLKGKRDYVILAMLVGCALCRQELAGLDPETIQSREGRWVLADLEGKGGRPDRRHPDLGQAWSERLAGRRWNRGRQASLMAKGFCLGEGRPETSGSTVLLRRVKLCHSCVILELDPSGILHLLE